MKISPGGEMSLVSCIMATKNRAVFLKQAIKYFQQQTYKDSELIIIDDSVHPCADIIPDDLRVRYIRLTIDTFLGEKLNIGIRNSSGSIIQKLDDDDYYHPQFLETTVSTLLHNENRELIVGMGTFLVLIVGHSRLYCAGDGWFAGGTLCFFREAWNAKPFRDIPSRVDVTFLEDHPQLQKISLSNQELYVLVRHGSHTWNTMKPRVVSPTYVSNERINVTQYFSDCLPYHKSLSQVMAPEESQFYCDLGRVQSFSQSC
jgi:glycosyltransferase involved in cell wall biosynthesis